MSDEAAYYIPVMNKSRQAFVAYALIDFAEGRLPARSWVEAFRGSLVPGTSVERYGRRWYLARWSESNDRWLIGKIVFESASEDEGVWDHERSDVRPFESLPVQAVPYVVDLKTKRVAFELRTQTVRPGTFQGNFQALIVKASNLPWRVTLEGVRQPPWEEWASRVDRLTAVWLTVRKPNPHSPLPELEELFERGVESAQIVARGENIDLEGADLLEAAFGHARDYGKITARGVTHEGGAERGEEWRSEEEGGVRRDRATRDESGHVPVQELERLLRDRSQNRPQTGDADE